MHASEKITNKKNVKWKKNHNKKQQKKHSKPHKRCSRTFAFSLSLMLFRKSMKGNHEEFWSALMNWEGAGKAPFEAFQQI